jgi:ribulose-phosphate 3-epimerase
VEHLLDSVDQILVMSVNPGFGGQKFIPRAVAKIRELRRMLDAQGLTADIEVDGGISEKTARAVVEAGANVLVAGAAIFGHADRKGRIDAIRQAVG